MIKISKAIKQQADASVKTAEDKIEEWESAFGPKGKVAEIKGEGLPDTIKNPEAFMRSITPIECPGCKLVFPFDGPFNWKWLTGCFSPLDILPMDFDGVVERNGHYAIFETKDSGAEIPRGQRITLDQLRVARTFTVFAIWGKEMPEQCSVIGMDGIHESVEGVDKIRAKVAEWWTRADSQV